MRAYCVTYDITNRSPKTIHVSKNSTFQIGVKVIDQNGNYIQSIKVRDENNTTLKQSGTLAEYRLYSATSGDSQGSKQWSVAFTQYTSAGAKNVKLPHLTIVTTSSDVAEIQPKEDMSAYWKKSDTEEHQLSGTYEDGTEFSLTVICKKA